MSDLDACRLCLSNTRILQRLTNNLASLIQTTLGFKVDRAPRLSNQICVRCITYVNNVHKFQQLILKNENMQRTKSRLPSPKLNIDRLLSTSNEVEDNDCILIPNRIEVIDLCEDDGEVEATPGPSDVLHNNRAANINEEIEEKRCANYAFQNNLDFTEFRDQYLAWLLSNSQENDDTTNIDSYRTIKMSGTFMCLTCFVEFQSQRELIDHYRYVELPKGIKEISERFGESTIALILVYSNFKPKYKCVVCLADIHCKDVMFKHIQTHFKPYMCNVCSSSLNNVQEMLNHNVLHYEFEYECKYRCGFQTIHSGAIREHKNNHKKEFKAWYDRRRNDEVGTDRFECKYCRKIFTSERFLSIHVVNFHTKDGQQTRHKCVFCLSCSPSQTILIDHMTSDHGLRNNEVCDECGRIMPDSLRLYFHQQEHKKPVETDDQFCHYTFVEKQYRTFHEMNHEGDALECDTCSHRFRRRFYLREHLKKRQRTTPEAAIELPSPSSPSPSSYSPYSPSPYSPSPSSSSLESMD